MPFQNCLLFSDTPIEHSAFTWLKIAFVKCLSDTAMSGFDNMIIQQHLLKKQCIMRIIMNSRR